MALLETLIILSEKAANIARLCREDHHLFDLLIQQKSENEANPRFVQDFKTLADVLIQEMVKHEVGAKFPTLRGSIKGEESNSFCNKLCETICVKIKNSPEETAELLQKVLNGDNKAARLLALEVHKEISLNQINLWKNLDDFEISNLDELGIWIDPIDSTAEYINASERKSGSGIFTSGLKCVTVLIGVYHKTSGNPVLGVINQPFYSNGSGLCYWGVCQNPYSDSPELPLRTNRISVSSSEDSEILKRLQSNGFEIVEAAGAGYKIFTVITGLADAYVLSKGTTFKWDTCGPQAILQAIGGDIVVYEELVNKNIVSLMYGAKDNLLCNSKGILAYRNREILEQLMEILSN